MFKAFLKRTVAVLLILCLSLSVLSVSATEVQTEVTDTVSKTEEITPTGPVSLDGKKFMFIGNSHLYYGNCINYGNKGGKDTGYFYNLILSVDEKATIIDHTYGGKTLKEIYNTTLSKIDSKEFLSYDYVILAESAKKHTDFIEYCDKIMALFPETTKFYYMNNHLIYEQNQIGFLDYFPILEEKGIEVIDWGKLVYDIYICRTAVPNATVTYNRNTFIKNNIGDINGSDSHIGANDDGDNIHVNLLGGYVSALMLFSAITGRSAEFMDYSFCNDSSLHKYFDFEKFANSHYYNPTDTNFIQVFESVPDMLGIQTLINRYNEEAGRHSLVSSPKLEPTCVRAGLSEGFYCSVCGEDIVPQKIIPSLGGHKIVFDASVEPDCVNEGKTQGAHCSVCNEILKPQEPIAPLGHKPETILLDTATIDKSGTTIDVCTVCGGLVSTDIIPHIISKDIKLSASSFTYTGKKIKPEVIVKDSLGNVLVNGVDYTVEIVGKAVKTGAYKVKVKFIGNYVGTKQLKFKIVPKTTSVKKLTTTKKKMVVRWTKKSNASAYRVEYSTDKNFKNSKKITVSKTKSSVTIKNLKSKKKYYVRVRLYKTVDKVKYYSDWSAKKSIKIK